MRNPGTLELTIFILCIVKVPSYAFHKMSADAGVIYTIRNRMETDRQTVYIYGDLLRDD